jgi:hypothetical protein
MPRLGASYAIYSGESTIQGCLNKMGTAHRTEEVNETNGALEMDSVVVLWQEEKSHMGAQKAPALDEGFFSTQLPC